MKIKEIARALENFAPLPLQEGYDNAGLQIGLTETEVTGALLCIDVTEAVIDEAIAKDCNLIVAHHPLIFKGCKTITESNYVERCIVKSIRNDIAIYAAHTNLDNAAGGVNHMIAQKLGLNMVKPLVPLNQDENTGSGTIGELNEPISELDFLKQVKQTFEVGCLRHNKLSGRLIQKVAVCGGAGDFLIEAAMQNRADVFMTGEIGYHKYFGHENDLLLVEIGHYESEQYTKDLIYNIIREECKTVKIQISKVNTNPIKYM